ncbi:AEC family transporter [Pullulanibacillus sp. KACC 23026]|uniref:AEC family transporter n=1 Tax=Pullulanibacillus sp. KACC 23026 TaxID=3028315 RepID=UPI0023B05F4B|nr:AEC family transporter [Pullulanibacillus sp. KACC 23026]WEG11168.1 AEC family transporter [Pullulanibacillus sp. KACC 23026]
MIEAILSTLWQVIVPLFIPVVMGAILFRFKNLDTKPFITVTLYFFTPALIFDTLTKAQISHGDVFKTFAFSVLNLILLWAVANAFGKLFKLPSDETAGLTLVSTFTNSVNYGLPLVLLAFGKAGLDKASVYVIMQMIIVNTIGIYFAARSQFSVKNALKSIFTLPAIYASIAAILFRMFDLHMPGGIAKGITMVSNAYSPIVLTILGAQMASVVMAKEEHKAQLSLWVGFLTRLVLSPFIALLCFYLLHIHGILESVLLVLACMPVAVNAVILAQKFNASPKLVSKCILYTTLLSFLFLPVLIVLIKKWVI